MAHPVSPSTPMIPSAPIDVAGWKADEEWARYPEGARAKSAYFPPDDVQLPDYIKGSRRYLFKRSAKPYPEQFWGEIAAYHIGCLLRVDVPPAYPAVNSETDQCAALIEWFYEDDRAQFVMGGHWMQMLIPSFDQKRGTQHNFQSIRALFRAFHMKGITNATWPKDWALMLLFDALCGNTDRHQNNWGVIFVRNGEQVTATLSPCFDNGTSLGYQLWEEHQGKNWNQGNWLKFIYKGTHHMKWTLNAPEREGHITGIQKIADLFPSLRPLMAFHLAAFDMGALHETLAQLSNIDMPVRLSPWRADLMYKLVAMRHDLLLKALQ